VRRITLPSMALSPTPSLQLTWSGMLAYPLSFISLVRSKIKFALGLGDGTRGRRADSGMDVENGI
jgi:hypothetical protein